MSSFALDLPTRPLVAADFLTLRRRRGLVVITALLTIGATTLTYAIIETFHAVSPATHGPAGGIEKLGHVAFLVSALGSVAAAIIGSIAAGGDLESGVYRDLVVTGRSRVALYASRIPAGLALLLPFVAAGYAVAAVGSVVFAGNLPEPSVGLLVDTGLWCLLQVTFYYLLAVGIAALLGSRAYTIGVLLAWRLAVTPILASISALGVARELVPGVALDALTPAGLGNSSRQGPNVPMSLAATAAVLICWVLATVVIGGRRDATRDA